MTEEIKPNTTEEFSEGQKIITEIQGLSESVKSGWCMEDKEEVVKLMDDFSNLRWGLLENTSYGKNLYVTIHHNFAHLIFPLKTYGANMEGVNTPPSSLDVKTKDLQKSLYVNIATGSLELSMALLPSDELKLTYINKDGITEEQVARNKRISDLIFSMNLIAMDYGVYEESDNQAVIQGLADIAKALEEEGLPLNESYVRAIQILMYGTTFALASNITSKEDTLREIMGKIEETYVKTTGGLENSGEYKKLIKASEMIRASIEADTFYSSDNLRRFLKSSQELK